MADNLERPKRLGQKDLIKALMKEGGLTKRQSEKAAVAVSSFLSAAITSFIPIKIKNIGTLEVYIKKPYINKYDILKPYAYKLKFSVTRSFREYLKQKSRMKWIKEYVEYEEEMEKIRAKNNRAKKGY